MIDGLLEGSGPDLEEAMLMLVEGVTAAAVVVWHFADVVEAQAM